MIIPDENSFQLQRDEAVTLLPPKKENDGKFILYHLIFSDLFKIAIMELYSL